MKNGGLGVSRAVSPRPQCRCLYQNTWSQNKIDFLRTLSLVAADATSPDPFNVQSHITTRTRPAAATQLPQLLLTS